MSCVLVGPGFSLLLLLGCRTYQEPSIEEEVAEFLGAAAKIVALQEELLELVSKRSDPWDSEIHAELGRSAYPGDQGARGARDRLLTRADRKAVFEAVLEELEGCPTNSREGLLRAELAHRLMFESVRGGFDWWFGAGVPEHYPEVVRGWRDFFDLNREISEFWKTGDRSGVRVPDRPTFVWSEIAMERGARILARTPVGEMIIEADSGLGRSFTWNGETRFAVLQPRPERWYGRLGIYYPGPGDHWEDHHGITRGVLEDSNLDFAGTDEARAWFRSRQGDMPHVVGERTGRRLVSLPAPAATQRGGLARQHSGAGRERSERSPRG